MRAKKVPGQFYDVDTDADKHEQEIHKYNINVAQYEALKKITNNFSLLWVNIKNIKALQESILKDFEQDEI